MTFDRHGRIGANLYFLILLFVIIPPGLRAFHASGLVYFLLSSILLVVGAWANARAIKRYGRGAAGEMLGLLSGLLVLTAVWGTAKIWVLVGGNPFWVDLVKLVSAAAISLLSVLVCKQIGENTALNEGDGV